MAPPPSSSTSSSASAAAAAAAAGGGGGRYNRVQLYYPTDAGSSLSLPPALTNSGSGASAGAGAGAGNGFLTHPVKFPSDDASHEEMLSWLRGVTDGGDDAVSADNGGNSGDRRSSRRSSNNSGNSNNSRTGDNGNNNNNNTSSRDNSRRLMAMRRARNRYLASKIESGGARIDSDGRIVPVLPPLLADDDNDEGGEGEGGGQQQHQHQHQQRVRDEDDDNDNDNGGEQSQEDIDGDDDGDDNGEAARLRLGPPAAWNGMERRPHPHQRMAVPHHPNDDESNVEFIPILPATPSSARRRRNNNNNHGQNNRGATAAAAGAANNDQAAVVEVPHPPDHDDDEPPPSLTLRRICFAVFAVVTAFVCIMLQTLPLLEGGRTMDPIVDPVLTELVVLRDVADHLVECDGDLTRRRRDRLPGTDEVWDSLMSLSHYAVEQLRCVYPFSSLGDPHCKPDCADGVLHIPSTRVLGKRYDEALIRDKGQSYLSDWPELQGLSEEERAEARRLKELYAPYKDGVDVDYSLSCTGSRGDERLQQIRADDDDDEAVPSTCPSPTTSISRVFQFSFMDWLSGGGRESEDEVMSVSTIQPKCFRGVHDGLITSREVDNALYMASDIIENGGDHIQIRRDVYQLEKSLPNVLLKIEKLLQTRHGVTCPRSSHLRPVAYRVLSSLPMEGASLSTLSGSIHSKFFPSRRTNLVNAVNNTVYYQWEAENRRRNHRPPFHSLRQLRPFAPKPFRDPCILMSDRAMSPDFAYHSSVFLSDGAGDDHTGGTELYVDAHRLNRNPRRRIQRGLLIDPSRGRVVVSSGGSENRRCKMPVRVGIRAVLDIWWSCD